MKLKQSIINNLWSIKSSDSINHRFQSPIIFFIFVPLFFSANILCLRQNWHTDRIGTNWSKLDKVFSVPIRPPTSVLVFTFQLGPYNSGIRVTVGLINFRKVSTAVNAERSVMLCASVGVASSENAVPTPTAHPTFVKTEEFAN